MGIKVADEAAGQILFRTFFKRLPPLSRQVAEMLAKHIVLVREIAVERRPADLSPANQLRDTDLPIVRLLHHLQQHSRGPGAHIVRVFIGCHDTIPPFCPVFLKRL